tara:strand:+ start:3564 stop:4049 length:486 start_codon:yes stop_codon:yes gene_type:complete
MNPQSTESSNQRFELSRIHDTQIDLVNGEVVFEIELELSHDNQRLFIGLLDTHRINEKSMSMQSGIAVSVNTKNGELRDPINDQNIIGSINQSSFDYKNTNFVCLEYEKIKSIYIPKLTFGEEKILLPAIHLPELRSLSIVVGSSAGNMAAKFNNPHLLIT